MNMKRTANKFQRAYMVAKARVQEVESQQEAIEKKFILLFRIFPIDFILTLVYNKSIKKGGDKVKKKKKKPTKSRVDVRTIVITAIVDFLVGLALLIIDKLT